jgi:hypothetical protein
LKRLHTHTLIRTLTLTLTHLQILISIYSKRWKSLVHYLQELIQTLHILKENKIIDANYIASVANLNMELSESGTGIEIPHTKSGL